MTRSQPTRSRKDTAKRQRRHLQGVEMVGRGVLREVQQPGAGRETKAEKFVRIAPRRLANILNLVAEFKKCADPEFYEYTDAQWKRLLTEYVAAAYDIRESFMSRGKIKHRNILIEPDLDTLGNELGLLDDLKDVL